VAVAGQSPKLLAQRVDLVTESVTVLFAQPIDALVCFVVQIQLVLTTIVAQEAVWLGISMMLVVWMAWVTLVFATKELVNAALRVPLASVFLVSPAKAVPPMLSPKTVALPALFGKTSSLISETLKQILTVTTVSL
jgi:hypothetical protein